MKQEVKSLECPNCGIDSWYYKKAEGKNLCGQCGAKMISRKRKRNAEM